MFKILKITTIFFVFCFLLVEKSHAFSLPLLSDAFTKKGFTEKQPFNISISYEYNSSNAFNATPINYTKTSYIDYNSITKSSNGIKTEASIYLTPFLQIFINYTYRESLLKIDYRAKQRENYLLTKDYFSTYSKKTSEHIYMAGFDLSYEWKVKKFTPYLSFKAGFGSTASSGYEDAFFSASFTLKAGTLITFNKYARLNLYAGADYTTLFNNGIMQENIDIIISTDNLMLGIPQQNVNAYLELAENYDDNLNMVLGVGLDIYKYISLFAEFKFINSFTAYSGIKFMF